MKHFKACLLVVVAAGAVVDATILMDVPKTTVSMTRSATPGWNHYVVTIDRLDQIFAPHLELDLLHPHVTAEWVATRDVSISVDVAVHTSGEVLLNNKRLHDGIQNVSIEKATFVTPKLQDDLLMQLGVRHLLDQLRVANVEVSAQIITIKRESSGRPAQTVDSHDVTPRPTPDSGATATGDEGPYMRVLKLTQRITSVEGVKVSQQEYVENIIEIHPNGDISDRVAPCVKADHDRPDFTVDHSGGHLARISTYGHGHGPAVNEPRPAVGHEATPTTAEGNLRDALRYAVAAPVHHATTFWSGLSPFVRVTLIAAIASFSIVTALLTIPLVLYHLFAFWSARRRRNATVNQGYSLYGDGMTSAEDMEAGKQGDVPPPSYTSVGAKDPSSAQPTETMPLTRGDDTAEH
ncbi:hypothetical protein IWQ60_001261 [Tieghemiomyces parasiticus]|uniref:Mid2 domain-containing protein n=1 Tax=Tieghemiomyces parasiticus TaxID=78921 RepID=A0A9W8AEI8_9FUNG|nr:hypothetical protein IWQ60_001261 [Tieghemiomyces parasiticus]